MCIIVLDNSLPYFLEQNFFSQIIGVTTVINVYCLFCVFINFCQVKCLDSFVMEHFYVCLESWVSRFYRYFVESIVVAVFRFVAAEWFCVWDILVRLQKVEIIKVIILC